MFVKYASFVLTVYDNVPTLSWMQTNIYLAVFPLLLCIYSMVLSNFNILVIALKHCLMDLKNMQS